MEVIVFAVLGLFVLITLFLGFFTVSQQTAAIIERFGKFDHIAEAGLNFKFPWIDYVAGVVNLRVQQLDVQVDTKTEDNVFVHVVISVQYYVVRDKVYEAFYPALARRHAGCISAANCGYDHLAFTGRR